MKKLDLTMNDRIDLVALLIYAKARVPADEKEWNKNADRLISKIRKSYISR